MLHHPAKAGRRTRHCDVGEFAERILLNIGKRGNSFSCHDVSNKPGVARGASPTRRKPGGFLSGVASGMCQFARENRWVPHLRYTTAPFQLYPHLPLNPAFLKLARSAPGSLGRMPLEQGRLMLVAFDAMGSTPALPLVTNADLIASSTPS